MNRPSCNKVHSLTAKATRKMGYHQADSRPFLVRLRPQVSLVQLTGPSFLPLTPRQCEKLVRRHHVYLPSTGRINLSGLNSTNIERFAAAIEAVLTKSQAGDVRLHEGARL